jgi:23S rRNA pseudouridine2605 synthase
MERLNKFLAHAGVGSRRHCDTLIAAGRVKINGQRVTDLGVRVDPVAHKVTVDDSPVRVEKPVYWAVHKPAGYVCTNHDPAGRPRAVDLLPHVEQRVYVVGRLDEASEGLLLMTNDGELAFALMHPKFGLEKTYLVQVAGKPTREDTQKLVDGVWISDGKARAMSVRRVKSQGESTWLSIVLAEGKNREIRRMLAKLGHKVVRVRRIAIGPVKLDKLPKGKARKITADELAALRKEVAAGQERIEEKLKPAAPKKLPPMVKLSGAPKPASPREPVPPERRLPPVRRPRSAPPRG